MGENKASLIVIIVLLVVSVPATIYGFINKIGTKKESATPVVNTNQNFYQDGVLNFYDFGTLLGTYNCKNTTGYCGWAYETVDDGDYSLHYYDDTSIDQYTIINSRYAFIVDTNMTDEFFRNAGVILYDILDGKEIATYKAVKNYTIGLENNYFIVENKDGKWGVIELGSTGTNAIIPFEYDFIGVKDNVDNTTSRLVADVFVAQKDSSWYIIDTNGSELSTGFSGQIYLYENNVIAVRSNMNGSVSLYTYDGEVLLNGNYYRDVKFYGKYAATLDTRGMFVLMNYETGEQATRNSYNVSSLEFVTFNTKKDGTIDVYVNNGIAETIS